MIICICGFGYSGSGAVKDYLREVDTLRSIDKSEVNFVDKGDGLLDLELHLCSGQRRHTGADLAIGRFRRLMEQFSRNFRDKDLQRKIMERTDAYVDSLVQLRWKANAPYDIDHGLHPRDPLWQRSLTALSDALYTPTLVSRSSPARYYYYRARRKLARGLDQVVTQSREVEIEHYFSVAPDDFLGKTRKYLVDLLDILAPGEGNDIVLDQPCPANNPSAVFHLFEDPRAIVVRRDPRDMYALQKHIYRRHWVPLDSVERFVEYYKIRFEEVSPEKQDASRVLNLRYEDLIYEYEATTKRIDDFLGVPRDRHVTKRFDPQRSCVNTRLFERYPNVFGGGQEFDYIAEHLKEYLYPFEKYPMIASDAKPF